jgi:hypothetical protein
MMSFVKVFRGVLVHGRIAASDMTARQTQAQVYPLVASLQALQAAVAAWLDVANLLHVFTRHCGHGNPQLLTCIKRATLSQATSDTNRRAARESISRDRPLNSMLNPTRIPSTHPAFAGQVR